MVSRGCIMFVHVNSQCINYKITKSIVVFVNINVLVNVEININ